MQLRSVKGFTIIELLIASIIILLVSIGFLRGILFYIQYSTSQKMKDMASQTNSNFVKYFDSLPYNLIQPTSYYDNWGFSSCDVYNPSGSVTENCTFTNEDSDGDSIPDFYDPYNGSNEKFSNPLSNLGSWLTIYPNSDGSCNMSKLNQPLPNIPNCIVSFKNDISIANFRIYTAVTIARVATTSLESGKAIGVITWYFDPITKKYKSIQTVLFKENNQ